MKEGFHLKTPIKHDLLDEAGGNGNILLTSRDQFDKLPVKRGFRHSERPQAKALWALPAGNGLVMGHGEYPCNRAHNAVGKSTSCSLTSAAITIGKRRGFLVSCKHIVDGNLAVFYDKA